MSKYQQQFSESIRRLDHKTRRDLLMAVEALAIATELIPSGGGSVEGPMPIGYESSVPSEVNMLAAEVVREGRKELQNIARMGARLRTRSQNAGTRPAFYAPPACESKRGRPSVLTYEMVRKAATLRDSRHTITSTIRLLALEYNVSESALWAIRERGDEAKPETLERSFWRALSGDEKEE